MQEKNEGWYAFNNGASIHDNPYDKNKEPMKWQDWRSGFFDAKQAEDSIGDSW